MLDLEQAFKRRLEGVEHGWVGHAVGHHGLQQVPVVKHWLFHSGSGIHDSRLCSGCSGGSSSLCSARWSCTLLFLLLRTRGAYVSACCRPRSCPILCLWTSNAGFKERKKSCPNASRITAGNEASSAVLGLRKVGPRWAVPRWGDVGRGMRRGPNGPAVRGEVRAREGGEGGQARGAEGGQRRHLLS